MNTEITRKYELPKTVCSSTSAIVDQYKHNHQENMPEASDLINIKNDLESLLSLSEKRTKDLRRGLSMIDTREDTITGKHVIRIKQELDETDTLPRNELSRQAALEHIKKKRRRDSTDDTHPSSELPHHIVKLKKLEDMPPLHARSETPPPSHDIKKAKKFIARPQPSVEPEEVDFVRVKPKDQVQITTFWSTLEPYFRHLTEEDRHFLLEKSDQGKPFLIPPLGQHYLEKWTEEDQMLMQHVDLLQPQHQPQHQKLKYLASEQSLTDQHLSQDDIGCGSLTERLISSLVLEGLVDPEEREQEEEDQEEQEEQEEYKKYNPKSILVSEPPDEIVGFEERLKRELQYAGLFNDEDADWNAREDDEICAELRALGRELKEQVDTNEYRKKKLLDVVECQLQYEQYRQVLDTLDSQVEQGYIKRFRPQKSKKRKANGPKATLSENTLYAMEKRKTWTEALGDIFKDKNMTQPQESIYDYSSS
ncbi:histone acetyltransferases subunit 3-domain-containing protein [Gilbertella persicaria]|uniref:Transcriptional regulator n=1 Tax=Rhizopus stolonifer TaxID=4846 RepID=A0A367J610_RHIST|nr:histone acetyltransferases subunit 3-domain-containing protein [Gilbertella persicaria]KAI8084359.1 histone acetyltransferases subunit 3-domain-containing protein [Gilbertella persicaria]RCH85387.1 Transcriptional regulator [Rhizopus stolonifer]